MQRMARFTFISLFILISGVVYSQSVSVMATLDSASLAIGQQAGLHIKVTGPATLRYSFPPFAGDTLIRGIEIVHRQPIDTVKLDQGFIQLTANYTVTSFDSGLYYIPPIKLLAGTDTIESNPLALKVLTYSVDTANYKLFDIKQHMNPPFVWSDYLLWPLLLLLLVALAAGGWRFWRKHRKSSTEDEEKIRLSKLPPHEAALQELDKLKSERPWKEGRINNFLTRLTEIIRTYMERRYHINALEMTTADILELFQKDKESQSVYQNLKQILQLADLVKFAKYQPLENENELSLMNAYLFVNQTKIEEVAPEEKMDETEKGGDNQDTILSSSNRTEEMKK